MIKGLDKIEVITLFVEDLPAAKEFYSTVLGLPVVYEDAASAVVGFENLMINLLRSGEADTLVRPVGVAGPDAGARVLFTFAVQDADAVCAELEQHGVSLLNGPVDRPWGRRTAAFADPAGHVWEIAQILPPAAG
ncbi:VOC family protein [Streptomyces sp. NPDC007088]|uniref:VOC family protein n=1 Tax=Streptomyces sp. NPDC007088 TaxID=3364773 RepID=UPI0036BC835C